MEHEIVRLREAVMRNAIFILISCALFTACARQQKPVEVSRAVYFCGDSLRYYAQKAYLEEDAQALFVTGAAAYMKQYVQEYPDSLPTVPLDEATIMLIRSAELGCQDAFNLIHCLDSEGKWGHSIPEK